MRRSLRDQRVYHRLKNELSVRASEDFFTGSIRMGHHAQHISLFVDDSRNVVQRSIGIRITCDLTSGVDISKYNLTIVFNPLERIGVCEKISISVADRDSKQLTTRQKVCEGRVGCLCTKVFKPADVLQADISEQRSR